MSHTKYTVTRFAEQWVATRINGDTVSLGHRPKYKQAQRLCEQSAGQALDWQRTVNGYEATR